MQTANPTDKSTGAVNYSQEDIGSKKSIQVFCRTSQGTELQASLLRITRFTAALELYFPDVVLHTSDVFEVFKIVREEQIIYSGSAVVRSLLDFGSVVICEAGLEENHWKDPATTTQNPAASVGGEFKIFLRDWEDYYKILPEFKLAVADLQSFLNALRLWADQLEARMRAHPFDAGKSKEAIHELMATATPAISAMFERFESIAATVPAELAPAHQKFCRQQLHPLLLCCPFMNRIFTKPLGYAGDYEMMNMIVRNEPEGASFFAKLLQTYILNQAPAIAVRNRVDYFVKQFVTECDRVAATGGRANICSIGCGPAREVERFIREHVQSQHVQFRLLDSNEETLSYTGHRLNQAKADHHRKTGIQLVKKPAQFLLKSSANFVLGEDQYDMIYCSGLYDYLNDRVIKALNTRLYDRLRPGGTLIVTNFDPYNPIRQIMEFIFDWFLIHRDGRHLATLAPEQASQDQAEVRAEHSGCNIFLQTRRPS